MRVEDFIARLDGVRRSGSGWAARCPSHQDKHQSLSVGKGEDHRILLNCHAGCEAERVVSALGLTLAELMPERPQDARLKRGEGGPSNPSRTTAALQHPPGCTLATYAEAKRLSVDFLKSLGLSDFSYLGAPAVRIPYLERDGKESAVRFRVGLSGEDRFRWKSGSRPILYGLGRLDTSVRHLVLCEGESDAQTLWHTGFPALGIPGASNWKEERDAPSLDGISLLYVVIEPDRGGETVMKWLSRSRIRERVRLVSLGGLKDPSALYLDDPSRFRGRFEQALRQATPWREYEGRVAETDRSEAWKVCRELAESENILATFLLDLARAGVVGEERTAQILFLAMVSRFLPRPVSCVVKGPSSGGKSFVTEKVLNFFSPSAYIVRSAMSERALAYGDEPLKHRVLVLLEAAGMGGELAQYLVRSLLSEGHVSYETVEKRGDGLHHRVIEREGPTGLLMTTTALRLHPENESRLLSLSVSDAPEQTRRVLRALAADGRQGTALDLGRWHALDRWLEGGMHEAVVPFAKALSEKIPPVAVRLRRDFAALLNLVWAHAILHQATRVRDKQGRVVATLDDYRVVRELVADLFAQGLERAVPESVRETVQAIGMLVPDRDSETSVAAVAQRLRLDKSSASRRVKQALDLGYLRNLEERKGRTYRLRLGEPLPDDVCVLPPAEELGCCSVAGDSAGISTPPPPLVEVL